MWLGLSIVITLLLYTRSIFYVYLRVAAVLCVKFIYYQPQNVV